MIFRQLRDPESSTYTYLLGCPSTREAVLIDPVREQVDRDTALLRELGLELRYVLDTHVHADHITSAWLLRRRLGATTCASAMGQVVGLDRPLADGETIRFGYFGLEARYTPGHTDSCVTYVLHDLSMAFTGDAVLIRGCGRTDFQQGDARRLYRSIHDRIFSLPDATVLYPAHDYKGLPATTVLEEKTWNPRLGGGRTEDDLVAIMGALKLPKPVKLDVALPANLALGFVAGDDAAAAPEGRAWAPVERTATGVPEVSVEWLQEHPTIAVVVDVREVAEWSGELGHIEGARLAPLDTLSHAAKDWDRAARYVLVCRTGGRSGRAAQTMESMGFASVASMAGGMARWSAWKLPVTRDAG